MEQITIGEATRRYGVSARMLRYYEQQGLLLSARREGYAYRVYDAAALAALRQVQILRRLRLSLSQIKRILQKPDAVTAVEVFRRNIGELDGEIATLAAIRAVLSHLRDALLAEANVRLPSLILEDKALMAAIDGLAPATNLKEEHMMEELKTATQGPRTLQDVRSVTLPPTAVAAAHVIGDEPENAAQAQIDSFVRDSDLLARKPDLRHYGFNHPNPVDETGYHGYEMWVTVPDDCAVPAPLTKKHFAGGLYAAHMIAMGNFHEWAWMIDWANASEKYCFAGDMADQEHMCGLMEEHINYVGHMQAGNSMPEDLQLDLLMPIRERT